MEYNEPPIRKYKKLTVAQKMEVVFKHQLGEYTYDQLAEHFGVSRRTIANILNYDNYQKQLAHNRSDKAKKKTYSKERIKLYHQRYQDKKKQEGSQNGDA